MTAINTWAEIFSDANRDTLRTTCIASYTANEAVYKADLFTMVTNWNYKFYPTAGENMATWLTFLVGPLASTEDLELIA